MKKKSEASEKKMKPNNFLSGHYFITAKVTEVSFHLFYCTLPPTSPPPVYCGFPHMPADTPTVRLSPPPSSLPYNLILFCGRDLSFPWTSSNTCSSCWHWLSCKCICNTWWILGIHACPVLHATTRQAWNIIFLYFFVLVWVSLCTFRTCVKMWDVHFLIYWKIYKPPPKQNAACFHITNKAPRQD